MFYAEQILRLCYRNVLFDHCSVNGERDELNELHGYLANMMHVHCLNQRRDELNELHGYLAIMMPVHCLNQG